MYTHVRDKQKISFKEYFVYSLSVLFFIMGTLLYIYPNVRLLDISYEYEKFESEKRILTQNNRLLRIELASQEYLENIENIALNNGFVIPEQDQIIYIVNNK